MSKRRCFSQSIIQSDSFIGLNPESQMLYIHLNMEADDEGFVNSAKRIARMTGVSDNSIAELVDNGFLIYFGGDVFVIKHWLLHNSIRPDRVKPTVYQEERAQITIKENGVYTLLLTTDGQMSDKCQPNVNQVADKCPPKLSKDKLSKVNSIEGKLSEVNKITDPSSYHLFGTYSNVHLTMEEYDTFKQECPIADERIDKLSNYIAKTNKYTAVKSHLELLRKFWLQDKDKQPSYSIDDYDGYQKPVYKPQS